MKIVHFSTFDIQGGAARAAYRLHQGLLAIGKDSRLLCRYKASSDSLVSQYQPNTSQNESQCFNHDNNEQISLDKISEGAIAPASQCYNDLTQKYYIDYNRTEISNTLFSLGYSGYDVSHNEIVNNSDVINLHWITSGFLSPVTIRQLLDLGKPVVWTFHDMWAFTGGCHYSAGCEGYQQDCHFCPQLQEDFYKLPYHLLQDKIELFSHPNLVIVTPSQWLTECVKNSQVFRHHRVETIPYSLDETVFYPIEKTEAKDKLKINPDTFLLLIGAMTGKEKRKGFAQLFTSLKLLKKDANINNLIFNDKIKFACFGEPSETLKELDIEVINLGNIQQDKDLSFIYSAANLFILPSLEDNFPNTMLEAMSCATPVISFAVGGMTDLIKDNINGVLIPAYDLDLMGEKIIQLINNPSQCQVMGINARKEIETNYRLSIQAEKYSNLYDNLITKNNDKKNNLMINSSNYLNNNTYLRGKYFNKIYGDVALHSLNKELAFTRDLLTKKESELRKTERMLTESEIMLEAMKSSKFWQLREKWFKIKKIFGF